MPNVWSDVLETNIVFLLTFLMATVPVVVDIYQKIAMFHQTFNMPISMFILTSNLTLVSYARCLEYAWDVVDDIVLDKHSS